MEFDIVVCASDSGKEPFTNWLLGLDSNTSRRIRQRIRRMTLGNFGDSKNLGDGVFEQRLFSKLQV